MHCQFYFKRYFGTVCTHINIDRPFRCKSDRRIVFILLEFFFIWSNVFVYWLTVKQASLLVQSASTRASYDKVNQLKAKGTGRILNYIFELKIALFLLFIYWIISVQSSHMCHKIDANINKKNVPSSTSCLFKLYANKN